MEESPSYIQKTLYQVAIIASVVLGLWFLAYTFKVVLLIFAAILIGVFFRGFGKWIHRNLGIAKKWSLAIAVLSTGLMMGVLILSVVFFAQDQMKELGQKVPENISEVKEEIRKTEWGASALEYAEKQGLWEQTSGKAQKFFSAVFGIFGGIGDVYIILLLGTLIMVNPKPYQEGFVHLLPKKRRARARELLDTLEVTLEKWLAGKLLSMLIVAIFTSLGLWIAGVPLALILGVSAGLFAFIPNFGPLIALGLGIIVASAQGYTTVIWTIVIYQVVQIVESNMITPYIQEQMISLPMAMILIAQLVLGVFTGILGLILATPIFAVVLVTVKMLYVEDVLGDHSFKLASQPEAN